MKTTTHRILRSSLMRPMTALLLLFVLAGCSNNPPAPQLPSLEGTEPQVQSAIRDAHAALAKDTSSAEAWGRYAMTLDVHDLAQPALDAYAKACELAPSEFKWWYFRANRIARTNPEASIPLFEKAQSLRPEYAALYVRFGRAQEQLGNADGARQLFERGAELDDKSALAFAGIGRLDLAAGQVDAAKTALERAIAIDPNCGVALSSLAQIYERLGQSEQAAAMSARADRAPRQGMLDDPVMGELEQLGMSTGQVINRAQAYSDAGAAQQAVNELDAVTLANPGRADAHIAKGQHLMELFRFEEAIASFQQAIAIDPSNVKAHLGLADALRFSRQTAAAIEEYRFVVERDQTIGEAFRGLGTCLVQQNDLAGALPIFRKAVALLPNDVASRIALGRIEYLEFNDAAAIAAMKPVIDGRDPVTPPDQNLVQALLYSGLAQLRSGNDEQGRTLVQEAMAAGANRVMVARELGEIRRAEMAVAILREAIARNPNDVNAMMGLAYELATTPEDDVRDGQEALRTIEAVIGRNAGGFRSQEIRAMALAETGKFTEAVQMLEETVMLIRETAPQFVIESMQQKIEQFKRNERFRHPLQLPGAQGP